MDKRKKQLRKEEKEFKELLATKYSLSKFTKVNDDWYPTYPKHLISVHLSIIWWKEKGSIRISAAGMDDFGLMKEYASKDINELFSMWDEWKKFYDNIPQTTNKRWYLDRGFDYD